MDKQHNIPSRTKSSIAFEIISLLILILCIIAGALAWRSGIFTDPKLLQSVVESWGAYGLILFFCIQLIQVIFPILPGGVSNLVGVILFGPWMGFAVNYFGISIGSIISFFIARACGIPLLYHLFDSNKVQKYQHWTVEKKTFTIFFGIAILLPGLPDDLICYIAGTTGLSFKKFTVLLLVGKFISIGLYSLFRIFLWNNIIT